MFHRLNRGATALRFLSDTPWQMVDELTCVDQDVEFSWCHLASYLEAPANLNFSHRP